MATRLRLICVLTTALVSLTHVNGKAFVPQASFDDQHVYFTVNAIAGVNETDGSLLNRKLELNWERFEDVLINDDWIGVFDYDPSKHDDAAGDQGDLALEKYAVTNGTGYQLSNVRLPSIDLREYNSIGDDNCLPYWLGYFRQGVNLPVRSNCLRIYPTWMNDLRDTIGDVPLYSLMIPGTHDTGAWKVYNGTEEDDNIISKYTYTQEENIFNQLTYGIRYLDVRVAYYKNTEELFWVNHGVVQIYPLITLLKDVIDFVKKTGEIVFMDFHRFPVGFDSEDIHDLCYEFVYGEMSEFLAPDTMSMDVTPNQLWAVGKLIILTYGDGYHLRHDVLWPTLPQAWGDVNTPANLEAYLEQALVDNGCRDKFWSAMAEQTPTTADIIARPYFGLRGFADEINSPLSRWYQRKEWYTNAHITATDFFLGNNIIEMSVEVNRDRVTCAASASSSSLKWFFKLL